MITFGKGLVPPNEFIVADEPVIVALADTANGPRLQVYDLLSNSSGTQMFVNWVIEALDFNNPATLVVGRLNPQDTRPRALVAHGFGLKSYEVENTRINALADAVPRYRVDVDEVEIDGNSLPVQSLGAHDMGGQSENGDLEVVTLGLSNGNSQGSQLVNSADKNDPTEVIAKHPINLPSRADCSFILPETLPGSPSRNLALLCGTSFYISDRVPDVSVSAGTVTTFGAPIPY